MQKKKIYFIVERINSVAQNKCKIGKTKRDAYKRVKELETGNCRDLYVHAKLETDYYNEWESFLQNYLKTFQINREWFSMTLEQIDMIISKIEGVIDKNPYELESVFFDDKFFKRPIVNNITINNVIRDNIINGDGNSNINIEKKDTNIESKEEDIIECHRCGKRFTSIYRKIQHWKSPIPCDYLCNKCGFKLNSHTSFITHKKSNCEYIPKFTKNKKKS